MKIFKHKDWRGNFGDDMNDDFVRELWPDFERCGMDNIFCIGTLLNEGAGKIKNSVVIGSGCGYGDSVDFDYESSVIYGVRGPLTAKKIGLTNNFVIGDPALLLPKMKSFSDGKSLLMGKSIVVVPHHRTSELWNFENISGSRYCYLDPGTTKINDLIATISQASLVVAEAMHAAIVASAFCVPFVPVSIRGKMEEFKWNDFYGAVGDNSIVFSKLSCPPLNIVRRVRLSKLRKFVDPVFGDPDFTGSKVKKIDFEKFEESINFVVKNSPKYYVDKSKLKAAQEKIKSAFDVAKNEEKK